MIQPEYPTILETCRLRVYSWLFNFSSFNINREQMIAGDLRRKSHMNDRDKTTNKPIYKS